MIRFGTCSWKYDSWRGIVYSDKENINYLKEYSQHFNTVEIDQWFWSLFPPNNVSLPDRRTVEEYAESVPDDFLFTIKVPNAITLTHFYNKDKTQPLVPNPYFLSNELFNEFLEKLSPMEDKIGSLIFQFEYLNKKKMSSLSRFQEMFRQFHSNLKNSVPAIGIEIRNPNYLNASYFQFINDLKLHHVFLEGYFMPPVTEIYSNYKYHVNDLTVIRLHGPDRKGIEKIARNNWDKIYVDREKELSGIIEMIKDLRNRDVDLFVNVNNHFEGSAPLTIERIRNELGEDV